VELISSERLYAVDTDYRGKYEMFGLEPGIYDIRASAVNRPSLTKANVTIPSVTEINIPLEDKPNELAMKYAPILYLHQDENFAPTTVQLMLDHSTINGQTSRTILAQLPLTDENALHGELMEIEISNLDDEYYKALYDNNKDTYINSHCVYTRNGFFTHKNQEYFVIQYWFFYLYNSFQPVDTIEIGNINLDMVTFKHEGDWEMIQLTWEGKPNNFDDPPRPDWVTCSHHLSGTTLKVRDNDKISWTDTHPHIFIALGSHASYFERSIYPLFRIEDHPIWFVDDATNNGVILTPIQPGENSNEIQYNLVNYPYPIEGWSRYRGRWGREDEINIPIIDKPIRSSAPLAPIEQVEKWSNPVGWSLKWSSE
jgi:hypothetical protein